jgi:O-antigen/teichoic acid export membrane protein
VFLFYWGPERYADWVALFSVASALTLFDFGLANFYGNALLIAWARRDRSEFDRMLRIGLGVVGACALAAFALSAPIVWLAPWARYFNLEVTSPAETVRVVLALAVCFAARLPLGLAFAIYRARGEQAAGIVAETLANLAQFGAVLAVLHVGGGLTEVAIAHALATATAWLGTIAHLRLRYRDVRLGVAMPRRPEIGTALGVGPYFAALPVALAVQVYGVVLVVAALAAPAMAVVYTTHRTLTGAARIVVGHLGQAVATELARQQTEGDHAAFSRLYAFLGRLVGAASGGVAGLIAVLGPAVMSIWTLGKVPFDPVVFWALVAAGLVTVPAEAADKLLSALNRPHGIAIAFGARSAVAILGCLALVPAYSAAGAAISIVAAEACTVAWMLPRESARYGHANAVRQVTLGWTATAIAFGLSATVAYAGVAVAGNGNLAEIALSAGLWALVAPAIGYFVLFDRVQRRDLAARAGAAIRRGGV